MNTDRFAEIERKLDEFEKRRKVKDTISFVILLVLVAIPAILLHFSIK